MRKEWVEPDIRDNVVETIINYRDRTEICLRELLCYVGLSRGKFYDWWNRYGSLSKNQKIPKAHWILDWEKQKIIDYYREHEYEGEGYRRLCYRMIDEDVVYVSPSTVYRVLKESQILRKSKICPISTRKGKGYIQPTRPHQEWHIDISYVNVRGSFMFLIVIIDGYSRYIVSSELRASMEEKDIEIVLQRGLEKFPNERPRIISDRGSQFISREFKSYIRDVGLTHTLISVGYPQSNGKLERFFGTAKKECIRKNSFLSIADAKDIVEGFIQYYNNKRLHSAIDYVAPLDILCGRKEEILKSRDEKLRKAREKRIEIYNQNSTLFCNANLSNSR